MSPFRTDFSRHLVIRSANPAGTYFHLWTSITKRGTEDFERVTTVFFGILNFFKSTVHDFTGRLFLTTEHDVVHETFNIY